MGIIYHGFKNEENDMIKIFSERPEGIYYDDIEKIFLRYLTPFQHSQVSPAPVKNFNTEKKALFQKNYQEAVANYGS